jgi:O-antigen/teichoic acid export membrane protein
MLMRLVARTGTPVILVSTGVAISLAIGGHADWAIIFLSACGFAIASGANNLLDSVQNASRCRHLVALHAGASAWLRLALALLLVWLCGASASIVLIGYVVGSVFVLASQYVSSRRLLQQTSCVATDRKPCRSAIPGRPDVDDGLSARKGRPTVASEVDPASVWFDRMWSYLWPSLLWGAFTWAFAASDRWSLQSFATIEDVGRYLVLYQLGYYPLSLLAGLVLQWVYPIVFAQAGDGTEPDRCRQAMQTSRRWLALMVIAVAAAVLVTLLGHRLVFQFFVSSSYRDVSQWLPGMMLASGLFALGQLATLPLVATAGSQAIARCKIGSSCLGMLLNAAGAWWGGVAGVVAAQVGFSATYAAWIMILLQIQSRRLRHDGSGNDSQSARKLAA